MLVTGIPEKRDEDCESMVRELISKKVGVNLLEKDVESAQRTGKRVTDDEGNSKPRSIVVKLANLKDKNEILRKAGHLDGSPYAVLDDTELHVEI